jgi:iron complex transport system substrate-binding protein
MRCICLVLAAAALAVACAVPEGGPVPGPEATPCQRIITLAPSITETAFALGLGDRVVGVGDYDQWPPEATTRPRLGGLINPNLERMVALQPDLAALLPSQDDIARRLGALGVEVLTLESETLDDVEAAYRRLGAACGAEAAAAAAVADFRRRLEPRPIAEGARVVLSLSRPVGEVATVRVAGPGTFLDELLHRLGAENAFADAPTLYPQVGLEAILTRAPDILVEIHPAPVSVATREALHRDWQRHAPRIPAVQGGRIAVIGGTFTVVPGPRLPELYEALAVALGGEAVR